MSFFPSVYWRSCHVTFSEPLKHVYIPLCPMNFILKSCYICFRVVILVFIDRSFAKLLYNTVTQWRIRLRSDKITPRISMTSSISGYFCSAPQTSWQHVVDHQTSIEWWFHIFSMVSDLTKHAPLLPCTWSRTSRELLFSTASIRIFAIVSPSILEHTLITTFEGL